MRDARVSEFAAPRRPQGHRKDERDFPIPIARSRVAFSDIAPDSRGHFTLIKHFHVDEVE